MLSFVLYSMQQVQYYVCPKVKFISMRQKKFTRKSIYAKYIHYKMHFFYNQL